MLLVHYKMCDKRQHLSKVVDNDVPKNAEEVSLICRKLEQYWGHRAALPFTVLGWSVMG